jgi:hypothetical protein
MVAAPTMGDRTTVTMPAPVEFVTCALNPA